MTDLLHASTLPDYDHVAMLDPLLFDSEMQELPRLNSRQDIKGIVALTIDAAQECELLEEPSIDETIATLRDFDFLVGSLLKHGVDPLKRIPGLENQLIRLGVMAQTVPRGTVYTYAVANPNDSRLRTFTGTDEEIAFITAVNKGTRAIESPIAELGSADTNYPESLVGLLDDCTNGVDSMVESIMSVRRIITPEFFTSVMRPYFEPLTVDGTQYTGAGGAQMQLLGIDSMLWGLDDTSDMYQQYFRHNQRYLSSHQLRAIATFAKTNNGSLLNWIKENRGDVPPEVTVSTSGLLRKIKKFRYPHRRVAQDNFKLRSKAAVGSGQYTPDILDLLIEKTETAISVVEGKTDEQV